MNYLLASVLKKQQNNEQANSVSKDDNSRNFKCLSLVLLYMYDSHHIIYCVNFENCQCFANCLRALLRA